MVRHLLRLLPTRTVRFLRPVSLLRLTFVVWCGYVCACVRVWVRVFAD